MNRHPTAPFTQQYPERPTISGQQSSYYADDLQSNHPNAQAPVYMNHHNARPQPSRAPATYYGAPSATPAQLYPTHLQSLAPKSYPGPLTDYNMNPVHSFHQATHANRLATLPNPLPQSHPGHRPYSPQEPSPQLPGYPGPPPFEYIPNATQSNVGNPPGVYHTPQPLLLQPQGQLNQPLASGPISPEDEAEIALAIALSEKMVIVEQEREEQLRKQEEEEFERVLAMSMMEANGHNTDAHHVSTSSTVQSEVPASDGPPSNTAPSRPSSSIQSHSVSPGNQPAASLEGPSTNTAPHDTGSQQSPNTNSERRPTLSQGEPGRIFRDDRTPLSNFSAEPVSDRPPSPLHILAPPDSTLDLTLPSAGVSRAASTGSKASGNMLGPQRSESPTELAYWKEDAKVPPNTAHPQPTPFSHPQTQSTQPVAAQADFDPMSLVDNKHFTPSVTTYTSMKPYPNSFSPHLPFKVYPGEIPTYDTHSLKKMTSNANLSTKALQGMATSNFSNVPAIPPGAAQPVTLVANSNQYIDPDLLLGVTIDFKPPVLLAQLRPMATTVPNIVSLPYGRVHPLHIQAPSWKHLLKLLTRMGATRFEPTAQARISGPSELKLRTVVQFVRIHPSSDDWRTILWFTIDHPVPPALPNAGKYKNPHTDLLPWSYELGDYPILLRNAADSAMSKTYTIPATEDLPYPTLPMTFPNLGLYLQAALDFSRQQKDDSNGYRKLAKMVQTCYHMDEASETVEKNTVGGLFKRVIKRGNNKKKTGKTNNEETYEYITPFVPDEWG